MITAIGSFALSKFESFTSFHLLAMQTALKTAVAVLKFKFRFRSFLQQSYLIAVQSVPIIVFSLTFVSLMLILEFSFHMKLVIRHDSLVPAFSTILLLRELGPVVTCLLLASRVGAGISAEIGSMKVTEQLDALKLLNIDTIEYLVIPRFFACILAGVTLSVLSIGTGILMGASLAWASLGYTVDQFYSTMFTFAKFHDVTTCVIKGAVFGAIIPLVAAHQGFRCAYGSEGVGNAATNAVVHATMLIIISDFLLTYLFYAV